MCEVYTGKNKNAKPPFGGPATQERLNRNQGRGVLTLTWTKILYPRLGFFCFDDGGCFVFKLTVGQDNFIVGGGGKLVCAN